MSFARNGFLQYCAFSNLQYYGFLLCNFLHFYFTINSKVKKRRLSIKPKYQDVFLSFNYTLLLEENYKISPGCILHIHGSIDENDIDPVIGHGRSDVEHKLRQSAQDASEEYDEKKASICNAMANYIARIQKDTAYYISCNQGFWSSIHDVETVIIMGHSLGEVDMPYFDEIR